MLFRESRVRCQRRISFRALLRSLTMRGAGVDFGEAEGNRILLISPIRSECANFDPASSLLPAGCRFSRRMSLVSPRLLFICCSSLGTRFCSCFRDNSVRAPCVLRVRAPLRNYIVTTRCKRGLRTIVFFDHAHKQRDTHVRACFLFSFP